MTNDLLCQPAFQRWAYHNAPYTLLDEVIGHATNLSLNLYTAMRLKTPTGMDGLFIPNGYNNVFYSTARSMARFGLLMQNKGVWNGVPIMTDSIYFHDMVNTSQNLNPSYGYLWWLNGKASYMIPQSQLVFSGFLCPNAPADMYAAMGKNGQFINVVPSDSLVWIRMGDAPDQVPVPFLLNDLIWSKINELHCLSVELPKTSSQSDLVSFFPNPSAGIFTIKANEGAVLDIRVVDLLGQIVYHNNAHSNNQKIDLSVCPSCIYFAHIRKKDHTNVLTLVKASF